MKQSRIFSKESAVLGVSSQNTARIIVAAIGICFLLTLLFLGKIPFLIAIFTIFLFCVSELNALLGRNSSPARHVQLIVGLAYLSLLFMLNGIHALPGGNILVLFTLFGTWGFDTFAYYAGSVWGKHKIVPKISPNKSFEGLIAGMLAVAIVALFLPAAQLTEHTNLLKITWFLAIAVGGFFGDLIESAFKRKVGVKDSSGLIPGHGGFLDRFDSLILTSTLSFVVLRIFL